MKEVITTLSSVTEPEFIKALQRFEANLSIGASAARNMGPSTVKEARHFLRDLDLAAFVSDSEDAFRQHLKKITLEFKNELACNSWGAARKFLNIFLRGALYNRYLCKLFHLEHIESFLEVPLDSHVAKAMRHRRNAAEGGLFHPAWRTIIGLTEDISQKYQDVASQVARQMGLARVHLDLWYWRGEGFEN